MPRVIDIYTTPSEMVLGTRLNSRVPEADQRRQRAEVEEILRRLRGQPGVVLADEVGMGKTFVALAAAYTVATQSPRGPVIVMVPANLVDKWEQDLKTFCELYLEERRPVLRDSAPRGELTGAGAVRYGVARHSVELMKLLDDRPRERCHLIFLAQGAMGRRQTDKWIRLALIAECLRRHARGGATRLIQVKGQIHRFMAELIWAVGEERAQDWGKELWHHLLRTDAGSWRAIYNEAVRDDRRRLTDDPVPMSVIRAMRRSEIDLRPLAEALKEMPIRAVGGPARVSARLDAARLALRTVEDGLWKVLLAKARWRSPLLVMDEAHHLKNPRTALARQLQSPSLRQDLRTGDGAMTRAFDRMLFLTATPFQLGHHELVHVLRRFGDTRWDDRALGDRGMFEEQVASLASCLDESQRTAIALQRCWARLRPEDGEADVEAWWERLLASPTDGLTHAQRAVVDAFRVAQSRRDIAERALRPWLLRHNKGACWAGTGIPRRQRVEGGCIAEREAQGGLAVPPRQLLPFFLAARSAISADRDLLGEALCSSYEAFRFTRQTRAAGKDEQDEPSPATVDLAHSLWYLGEFDRTLGLRTGSSHPKVSATVARVVDLWDAGEKVLVFAFYRQTCRALRVHISREVERRLMTGAQRQLREAGRNGTQEEVDQLLVRAQSRYFDDVDSPGRRAVDGALGEILESRSQLLRDAGVTAGQRDSLVDIMRRFLRASTTLVRCFPLAALDAIGPTEAIMATLDYADASGLSWRTKFEAFIELITEQSSAEERRLSLEAAQAVQTGRIRVETQEEEGPGGDVPTVTLPNVQVATGTTRRGTRARLMRAFNTPFFPDILVCSEVMGEGVDLQRFCRHVIHHDIAWNPSTVEQRTGRVDRIGCKAEGRHPIVLYLPYVAGAADERQFQVMSDRERWFRVVMGQDEVARLVTPDSETAVPLPDAVSEKLTFRLGLDGPPR